MSSTPTAWSVSVVRSFIDTNILVYADDAFDSGGSGCSGTSSGGGWAGDVDGDTASGGAALAGGLCGKAPQGMNATTCHTF